MRLAVGADPRSDEALQQRAARLAGQLNLSLGGAHDMLLAVTAQRLELRVAGDKGRAVSANPGSIDVTTPAGRSLKQPLARALGIKRRADLPLAVIDATAGFGEDSWLMAGLGCQVTAIERHAVVGELLRDGLMRAQADIAARVTLRIGDARELLATVTPMPDVVYLDPMYPGGRKTAERKAMKVLRQLVGEDDDAAALLEQALGVAKRRVVVKRPPRAQPLGGEPVHTHRGKGVRYDVYAITNRRPS